MSDIEVIQCAIKGIRDCEETIDNLKVIEVHVKAMADLEAQLRVHEAYQDLIGGIMNAL